jgi:phosphotransferase family enzyme
VEPTPREAANVARALKKLRAEPAAWGPVTTSGYTPARRWVVTLADGSTAFVKVATDEQTASWLRDEHLAYSVLRGAPFMPGYLGWYDDGEGPVLALEDLSHAAWPPPWTAESIAAARDALQALHAVPPYEDLPSADDDHLGLREGWQEVAGDPAAFLALGLSSAAWLERHLGTLDEAARSAPLGGGALLHLDVRSGNVCIRAGRALFVDWNWVTVGNPDLDLARWLPSLRAEGGPAPDEIAPGLGGLAAAVAGYACSRAGLPSIPTAPGVRPLQLRYARTALPWACRELGVPEPDGSAR